MYFFFFRFFLFSSQFFQQTYRNVHGEQVVQLYPLSVMSPLVPPPFPVYSYISISFIMHTFNG